MLDPPLDEYEGDTASWRRAGIGAAIIGGVGLVGGVAGLALRNRGASSSAAMKSAASLAAGTGLVGTLGGGGFGLYAWHKYAGQDDAGRKMGKDLDKGIAEVESALSPRATDPAAPAPEPVITPAERTAMIAQLAMLQRQDPATYSTLASKMNLPPWAEPAVVLDAVLAYEFQPSTAASPAVGGDGSTQVVRDAPGRGVAGPLVCDHG